MSTLQVLLVLVLQVSCARIQAMPPLPDLGHLGLSPPDSARLVRAAKADPTEVLGCFDSSRGDTAGITRPVRIRGSTDAYPSTARKNGRQGWVALAFIIGTDGRAETNSVIILAASDTVFVDAARFVIANSVFIPARRNGTPVRALARQFTEFKLR